MARKDIKTQAYQRLRNWRGVKGLDVSLFSNKEELIKQLFLDVFEETDELLLISHTPNQELESMLKSFFKFLRDEFEKLTL